MYDAIIVGGCNLEICVDDHALAEGLSRECPQSRKLYPEIRQSGDNYVVCPSKQFGQGLLRKIVGDRNEVLISGGAVKKRLAAGGGANASKVLAKLGARVLLITSIGQKDDPNYETLCDSLKQEPAVECLDIPGRPSVGLTLNVYGGGSQSTLLIYGGRGTWADDEFRRGMQTLARDLNLQRLPVMAIGLSPQYLPLLRLIQLEKGKMEYFCPSRSHINILRPKTEDSRHFRSASFVQVNIEEMRDIGSRLYGGDHVLGTEDRCDATIMSECHNDWKNNIIVTRGGRGVYLLKTGESDLISFSVCRKLPGELVDDTGAGDAFAGAFFSAHFLGGKEVEEGVKFASTFAAFTLTDIGATGRLPSKGDVEDWMVEYGPTMSLYDPEQEEGRKYGHPEH